MAALIASFERSLASLARLLPPERRVSFQIPRVAVPDSPLRQPIEKFFAETAWQKHAITAAKPSTVLADKTVKTPMAKELGSFFAQTAWTLENPLPVVPADLEPLMNSDDFFADVRW